jgi:hypothetical protein
MAVLAALVDGVIGVDPHRDTLTAAAVGHLGGVLARTTISADPPGTSGCSAWPTASCLAVAAGRSRERAASAPA